MRYGTRGVLLLVATGLLFSAMGLFWLSMSSSPDRYMSAIATLRQLQRLDASWSLEMARVRSAQRADFDALAAFVPRIAVLKDRLAILAASSEALTEATRNRLRAYLSQMDAKQERVERFKTAFAVLRNSVDYLPLAAAGAARASADAGRAELAAAVETRLDELQAFLAQPGDALARGLALRLDALGKQTAELPRSISEPVSRFVAHAQVVLDKHGPAAELFAAATVGDTADTAEHLISDLSAVAGRRQQVSRHSHRGLMGVTVALFAVGVTAAVRRRDHWDGSGSAFVSADDESIAALGGLHGAGPDLLAGMVADELATRNAALAASCTALHRGVEALGRHRRVRPADALRAGGEAGEASLQELHQAGADIAAQLACYQELQRDLQRFADAMSVLERDWIDVNACLRSITSDLGLKEVVLDEHYGDLPPAHQSAATLRLIFSIVLDNAMVGIAEQDLRAGRIRIETQARGDQVTLTVTDNGAGMDQASRKHPPLVYQRPAASGLGLGAVAYLARRLGGRTLLSSARGRGTSVRVMLPVDGGHSTRLPAVEG